MNEHRIGVNDDVEIIHNALENSFQDTVSGEVLISDMNGSCTLLNTFRSE